MAKRSTSKRPSFASDDRRGRSLVFVLGDQLDGNASAIRCLDPGRDLVLMAEVSDESRRIPSHIQRTVLFFAAMRHFARQLRDRGIDVRYTSITDEGNTHTLAGELRRACESVKPDQIIITEPGDWSVLAAIRAEADALGIELRVLPDEHFLTSRDEFAAWAEGKKHLVMEFFYRWQRKRLGILMDGDQPAGGIWNFDKDNRLPFGKEGPKPRPPRPPRFPIDSITRAVIADVHRALPGLPGRLDDDVELHWPVTREQSLQALDDFANHRLHAFGPYEDAMWSGEPWLYHSVLSAALNLKLLNPRECIAAAIQTLKRPKASRPPLQSVEAFVRQIIGWREFIRGVYWLEGPDYRNRNSMGRHGRLPEFYWDGDTDMSCLRHGIGQVLEHGYAHHIQRLMVLSNFALIAGIDPARLNDWFLGMFVDGVDWVTSPNVIGMALHSDAPPVGSPRHGASGVVGTKPYCASANYIGRMSNYCGTCAYDPSLRIDTGARRACPFNTFYWDFLIRNAERFDSNPRMTMMLRNARRLPAREVVQITSSAARLRARFGIDSAATPPATSGRKDR